MNAKLHIQAASRNAITFLEQCYCTPPFKLANITEDKKANSLHLMVMSSSPGILDGDDFEINIELKENSSMQLHTQSYQRLFNMKNGAKQVMQINLRQGCSFIYLPHPAVPHENSIFTSNNKIYVSGNCRLIWGEVLTCGRKMNSEIFRFSKYHNITQVFINGKLKVKENLLMQPSIINPNIIGQMEGFTHQASLIYLDEKGSVTELAQRIHDYLFYQKEILFGVSCFIDSGVIVRILGQGAEQLHHQLKTIASLLSEQPVIESLPHDYAI